MSELTETLREEFKDKETRHVYCDEFLNSSIATQIKVLREQRKWTQRELAESAGMRQERISVLEDVNYSSWTINVLRRLAEAFDLTLTVKFESFGEKLFAIEDMSRETLEKPSFDEDPMFQQNVSSTSTWFPPITPTKLGSPNFNSGRIIHRAVDEEWGLPVWPMFGEQIPIMLLEKGEGTNTELQRFALAFALK
ncbi:MAG: helix-turn-helix domain-containing protein [Pyrinomonadaceae bacterium]